MTLIDPFSLSATEQIVLAKRLRENAYQAALAEIAEVAATEPQLESILIEGLRSNFWGDPVKVNGQEMPDFEPGKIVYGETKAGSFIAPTLVERLEAKIDQNTLGIVLDRHTKEDQGVDGVLLTFGKDKQVEVKVQRDYYS